MTLAEQEEYRSLRATIRERGTARVWVFVGGIVAWAALITATAALAALRGKNPMREYYEHLLEAGVAERNARHAVARYIARISYGMLKNGTRYEPYRWRGTAKEAV